jgi:hypothetical protein
VRRIEAEEKEMARGGETKKLWCKKKTGSARWAKVKPKPAGPYIPVTRADTTMGLMGQTVEATSQLSSQPIETMGRTQLGLHQEGMGHFSIYYFSVTLL